MPGRLWRLSLVFLAIVFVADASAQQAVCWRSDLEAAKQEARQTNRLVLVHYWANWCPACYRMEREVFVDPAVAAAVHEKFVPVKLNFDHCQVDARAMGVTILPTDVVISPNGEVVGTLRGFAEPIQYVALLTKVGVDSRPLPQNGFGQAPVSQSGPISQPVAGQPAVGQPVAVGQPSASSQPGIVGRPGPAGPPTDYLGERYAGYRGNQFASANPVQHSPQYTTQTEAHGNLNANASPLGQSLPGHYSPTPMLSGRSQPGQQQAAQQQFQQKPPVQQPVTRHQQQPVPSRVVQQQPAKAATGPSPPKFGLDGFCPVTLVEKKAWKFGDRRWGAVHLGVTYLFSGLEEQQKFLKTPDRYSPVCKGNDIVMLLDKGQAVPGARRHGVSFGGRVYLFSSQASLDAFTKQPRHYITGYSQLTQAHRPQYGQGLR